MADKESLTKIDKIKKLLDQPIDPNRIKDNDPAYGYGRYLESWDIINHLNNIFCYGGWNTEIKNLKLLSERKYVNPKNNIEMVTVAYCCECRLSVKEFNDFREDVGIGSGTAKAKNIEDAHDLALKTAVSDAIKRCARHYGEQFGNNLYDNSNSPKKFPKQNNKQTSVSTPKKTQTTELQMCVDCGQPIYNKDVLNFSMGKYKEYVCWNCQQNRPDKSASSKKTKPDKQKIENDLDEIFGPSEKVPSGVPF